MLTICGRVSQRHAEEMGIGGAFRTGGGFTHDDEQSDRSPDHPSKQGAGVTAANHVQRFPERLYMTENHVDAGQTSIERAPFMCLSEFLEHIVEDVGVEGHSPAEFDALCPVAVVQFGQMFVEDLLPWRRRNAGSRLGQVRGTGDDQVDRIRPVAVRSRSGRSPRRGVHRGVAGGEGSTMHDRRRQRRTRRAGTHPGGADSSRGPGGILADKVGVGARRVLGF